MITFPVSTAKSDALKSRMQELGIFEADLEEKFIRGSGSGGQKINKTSSTVYLKHHISGIELKCQESRQLSMNRYYARVRLCDLLEERVKGEESKLAKLSNKIKKQKAKRSKRAKNKMLKDKKHVGQVKAQRKKVSSED